MIVSFTIWCSSQLSLSKDIICAILYYGWKYTALVRRKIIHSHPRTPGLGVFLIAQPHIDNAHYQQKFKSCVVVVELILFLSYFPEEATPLGWIPEGKHHGGGLSHLTKKRGMNSVACHWGLLLFNTVAHLPKNV